MQVPPLKSLLRASQTAKRYYATSCFFLYPSATSSTIISTNPNENAMVPKLLCSPSDISGINYPGASPQTSTGRLPPLATQRSGVFAINGLLFSHLRAQMVIRPCTYMCKALRSKLRGMYPNRLRRINGMYSRLHCYAANSSR